MLLDRQKAKFWQRIVFGAMAFLMIAWLVPTFGIRACSDSEDESQIERLTIQIDELEADLSADPKSGDIMKRLADAYASRGNLYLDDEADKREADYERALELYAGFLDMKQAAGATKAARLAAIEAMIKVSQRLEDPIGVLAGFNRVVDEEPDVADNWIDLALAAEAAGKPGTAILAYEKYLVLEPDAPNADAVKEKIKTLKAQAKIQENAPPTSPPAGE